MKVIFGIDKVRGLRSPVVAIGVFDGVHRGHRKILTAVVRRAKSLGVKSAVLTFWPHPQKEKKLYSLEHRLRLIEDLGIDICIVSGFSRRISSIKPKDFVEKILAKKIRAGYVYVGSDFKFGNRAEGDASLLKRTGEEYGIKTEVFKIIKDSGKSISSTLIRGLISQGEINHAKSLLGRPVSILGTVIRGSSLGRILGFPTANIDPHHEVIPPCGIYAVRIIFAGRKFKGVCYIGKRPTITRTDKINIEVHVLNFSQNIYGKSLEIQFLSRIRSDKKFPTISLLVRQIRKDISIASKVRL